MTKDEYNAYQRRYYSKNRDRLRALRKHRYSYGRHYSGAIVQRRARYKSKYGLTIEAYNAMLADQNGVCAACKLPQSNGRHLCVDHCHTSGTVRGLLCTYCNIMVGLIEQRERHRNCLKYLKKYNERVQQSVV